ncbi:DUF192 domain-containing protein [Candidatus Uhrbacteria bacterium]|nr:DUF192 domain-containing protein [Candidatus Uhrbacteria bacterium]
MRTAIVTIIAVLVGFAAGTLARQGGLGAPVQKAAETIAEKVLFSKAVEKPELAKPTKPARTLKLTALKKGSKKKVSSPTDSAPNILSLGTEAVKMDALTTKQEQMKGYTNRKRPADNHGFLYVLDKPSRYAYWMKNMLFTTDVVWLDETMKVVDLRSSIAPQTYPDQIFEPIQPASYMLEFPDGFIARHGVEAGDVVDVSVFLK